MIKKWSCAPLRMLLAGAPDPDQKSRNVPGLCIGHYDHGSLGRIPVWNQDAAPGYILGITIILWFTVLFANFAEAIAEGRGKGPGGFPTGGKTRCGSA